MAITKRTIIRDLLEEYPEAKEVFENFGLEVDELGPMSTLEDVCKDEGINYWELKSDIINSAEWRIDDSEDIEDDEEDDENETDDEFNEWDDDEDDYDVEDDDMDGEDEDEEEPEEDE